jgi:hypothetical protein
MISSLVMMCDDDACVCTSCLVRAAMADATCFICLPKIGEEEKLT